jgi:hypothetical protein
VAKSRRILSRRPDDAPHGVQAGRAGVRRTRRESARHGVRRPRRRPPCTCPARRDVRRVRGARSAAHPPLPAAWPRVRPHVRTGACAHPLLSHPPLSPSSLTLLSNPTLLTSPFPSPILTQAEGLIMSCSPLPSPPLRSSHSPPFPPPIPLRRRRASVVSSSLSTSRPHPLPRSSTRPTSLQSLISARCSPTSQRAHPPHLTSPHTLPHHASSLPPRSV